MQRPTLQPWRKSLLVFQSSVGKACRLCSLGSCKILLSLQWADSQGSFKSSCRRNSPQKQLGDALDEHHSSKAEEGQCRLQP